MYNNINLKMYCGEELLNIIFGVNYNSGVTYAIGTLL